MRTIFCIIGILLLVSCTTTVPEVKETSPFPPHPEMEPPLYAPTEDAPFNERVFFIEVTKGGFSPESITINAGAEVKLLVTALDNDYDFRMPDFGIEEHLPQSQEVIISFTPAAGTFEYICDQCGSGEIIVR